MASQPRPNHNFYWTHLPYGKPHDPPLYFGILFWAIPPQMMIDRASVLGMSGTAATFGLSTFDSMIGIAVGLVTLVYMSIKLYQEVKKK
jgi:hypothetical protein